MDTKTYYIMSFICAIILMVAAILQEDSLTQVVTSNSQMMLDLDMKATYLISLTKKEGEILDSIKNRTSCDTVRLRELDAYIGKETYILRQGMITTNKEWKHIKHLRFLCNTLWILFFISTGFTLWFLFEKNME